MDPKIGSNNIPLTQPQTLEELSAPLVSSKLQSSSGSPSTNSWVEQVSQRLPQILALVQKIADATCAESSGASTQSAQALSPEQARYEKELAAYQEAVATNERVDAHNAKLDKEIAYLEKQAESLRTLFAHVDATSDGVLTWAELRKLSLQSSMDSVRDAASWLLSHQEVYGQLPRKWTLGGGDTSFKEAPFADGCGIDVLASATYLAALTRRIGEKKELRLEKVPVGSEPTMSVDGKASGSSAPASTEGSSATASSGASSTSASGVGIDGALDALYTKQASLEEQISAAAAKAGSDDPNVAAEGQREMQRLMNRQQALANMINLLTTMMSNLAKLYSDMAMTAVRNIK